MEKQGQQRHLPALGITHLSVFLLLLLSAHYGEAVDVWIGGDVSQEALWGEYAAGYLNHKASVHVSFEADIGVNSLSVLAEGKVDLAILGAELTPDVTAPLAGTDAGGYLFQLPFVGTAMVAAYNLPTLQPSDPPLTLNGETLARIYLGDIRFWNDSAIAALNSELALASKLPSEKILLSAYWDQALEVTQVFGDMMCDFSASFQTAYDSVGRNLTLMPPAADGMTISESHEAQAEFVSTTQYSLAYMDLTFATRVNVTSASMVNREGQTVTPTTTSIRSAMEAMSDQIQEGSYTLNLTNAPQAESWPMSYLLYATLSRNLTNPLSGCPTTKELLNIIFWSQTNPAALALAETHHYATLPIPLLRLLLNAINSIQCNGRQSFSTAAVMGVGTSLDIYSSWADEQSSRSEVFQYFRTDNQDAVTDMTLGFTDFGGLDSELTVAQAAGLPDVAVLPMVAHAVVPAHSVDVYAYGRIYFDLPTVADIYLGNIQWWNDSRILTMNAHLADHIPSVPICVIYQTNPSVVTQVFTTVLARNVPQFAEQITPGMQVTFPNLHSCSIGIDGNIIDSFELPNAFGMWVMPDIIPSPWAAPTIVTNAAGNEASSQPARDIVSALLEYQDPLPADEAIFKLEGKEGNSWPFVVGSSVMFHTRPTTNCASSAALLDWIWWTQSDITAIEMADNYGMAVASTNAAVKRRILNTLASVTCQGETTFSLAGCVFNGTFCSDRGTCSTDGVCACNAGFTGNYCELESSSSDSLSTAAVLGIVLGVLLPLFCLLLFLVPLIVVAVVLVLLRANRRKSEWEINPDEIELGEPLGMGGFGCVYKARWRGTDVAVKMLPSHNPSKDMVNNFKDEIHVMMALRHPNVVLFMAASTKPEKMCLVMELMALGSLYDVLHNELIPELPFQLKVKLAYQAAKGMHFLHSSGIVHRDLKSLNLLLDNKWNVKVSDFGLTKFKQEIKTGKEGNEGLGSIPWTAPEVLNDQPDLDYVLADVYSFGIILWELLTRSNPYPGLSPAAVAVAVIRDDARPKLPDEESLHVTPEYDELMRSCWHIDPSIRPTFLEIVTRLSSMAGEVSSSSQGGSSSSASTFTSTNTGRAARQRRRAGSRASADGSLSSSSAGNSAGSSVFNYPMMTASATTRLRGTTTNTNSFGAIAARVQAPSGEVAIVFSDVTSAASLWEFNPEAMKDATLAHNQLLRSLLAKHRGYEVRSIRERNTGEGSFCMVFQDPLAAIHWCADAQRALLEVEWPASLLTHPGAAEEWGDTDDRIMYKGLRVRMGVHVGEPRMAKDPTTRKMDYYGPPVNAAAHITAMAHGGQVVVSEALRSALEPQDRPHLLDLGRFEMNDAPSGTAHLYECKVVGLEGRFFGGVSGRRGGAADTGSPRAGDNDDSVDGESSGTSAVVQTAVGDGLANNEDRFLTSANLCRWVIDFSEIGMGSYGVVYKGTWKGVDVAVKRFIKQNLDERRLLEFRAEMAFLSELHHPNIVLFIGACVRMPNLCIVTEFVRQGCLKAILLNRSVKLAWNQRLRMLKSAALGVNYLHSLTPVIIHRDLKPSNLLVDENWNVKIADFGFARIKEENATMTRCGTPCWTAPEVIRGEKYTEKADVYSFGVIMWEMLTRKQPFAGRNFMGVSLDVLEGRRPQMPSDCPDSFRKMIERCWHAKDSKRPAMDELLGFFDSLIGETSRGLDAV